MIALSALAVTISVTAGVRCFDVRAPDGGCLVAQNVAAAWRYGEIHGAFLANDFPGGNIVVGVGWGGDIGTPLYSLAHDRLRLGGRLTVDGNLVVVPTASWRLDASVLTVTAGPQLWVRLSPWAFLVARGGVGGSIYWSKVMGFGPFHALPTVDGALGFAFPLD
jgi:hypothetical protein